MEIKPAMVAIAAFVVITVIAAVLMPVLNDATKTEDTYTNDGFARASQLTADSERTLVFDHTNPNILTIDGVDVDMTALDSPYNAISVVFSNDWFMRYNVGSSIILYKCGTSSAAAIATASVSSEKDASVTISSGSATIVIGESTYNYTVDGAGLMLTSDGTGDYVVKTASSKVFVNSDSVVYGVGRTDKALGTSGTSFNVIISASIDDGITPIYYSPQYTFSNNYSINDTAVSGHEDLYELTGFTFNLASGGEDHPVTYNQIFVPYEVTAERTVQLTGNESAILMVVPVLLIVAIIVGILAVAMRGRE